MPTAEIAGVSLEVNEEGYLLDHNKWTKDIAAHIAKEEGITDLTDGHWKVIDFLRAEVNAGRETPSVRKITKNSGVNTKELYKLFPGGPAKKASKIAGVPKPVSCV